MNGNVVDGLTFTIDARAFSTATNLVDNTLVRLSFANTTDTDDDGDFDTGTFMVTSTLGHTATGTVAFVPNAFSLDADASSTFPNNSGLGPDDLFTCSTSAAICRIEVTAVDPAGVPVDGPAVLGTLTLVMGPATTLQAFSSQPQSVNIDVDAAGNVFIDGVDKAVTTSRQDPAVSAMFFSCTRRFTVRHFPLS